MRILWRAPTWILEEGSMTFWKIQQDWSSHDTINVGGARTPDDSAHGGFEFIEQQNFNKGDLQHCSLQVLMQSHGNDPLDTALLTVCSCLSEGYCFSLCTSMFRDESQRIFEAAAKAAGVKKPRRVELPMPKTFENKQSGRLSLTRLSRTIWQKGTGRV